MRLLQLHDEIADALVFARGKGCPVACIRIRRDLDHLFFVRRFPDHTVLEAVIANPWMLKLECGYIDFRGNERTHITPGVLETERELIRHPHRRHQAPCPMEAHPLWGTFA